MNIPREVTGKLPEDWAEEHPSPPSPDFKKSGKGQRAVPLTKGEDREAKFINDGKAGVAEIVNMEPRSS